MAGTGLSRLPLISLPRQVKILTNDLERPMYGFTEVPTIFFSIRKLSGKYVRICDLINLCSGLSKEMFVGL